MSNHHRFSDTERAAIYRVIAERRDMRHFLPDPVDPIVLKCLLAAAHQAPSVGLMQPWRFIRITDIQLRSAIASLVEAERRRTAEALAERSDEFMRLKVDGIRSALLKRWRLLMVLQVDAFLGLDTSAKGMFDVGHFSDGIRGFTKRVGCATSGNDNMLHGWTILEIAQYRG